MTRDFTSEAEELMLQLISSSVVGSSIDYATPELEEYEDWKEELKSYIDSLYADVQEQIENRDYAYKNLATLFVILRGADGRTAREIRKYEEITFDSYMKTMKGLLESIRVTSGVSSITNVDAIGQALGGYTANPNSYVVNESIFADVDSFSAKIDDAGTGLLGQTYDRLYPKDGDWTAIDELMLKSKSEVEPWEVIALSQIVDAYVILDNETGVVKLDCEGYAKFLEHCYIQTEFRDEQHYIDNSPYYAKYEVSPVCEMLSEYIDNRTTQYIIEDGKCMKYSYAYSEKSFLITQCYINDSLYGICKYVSTKEIYAYVYEDAMMDIIISIDDNENIKIEIPGNNGEKKHINIYGLSLDVDGEFHDALESSYDKKSKWYIDTLELINSNIVDKFKYGGILNNIYGLYQIFGGEMESMDEEQKQKWVNDLGRYLACMNMGGTVIQYEDEYTFNNLMINENQLAVDVAYYNYANQEGNITSVEELQQEFNCFIVGKGSYDNLESFEEFDKNDGFHGGEYEDYLDAVDDYIEYNFNCDLNYATPEQINEAIEEVNKGE